MSRMLKILLLALAMTVPTFAQSDADLKQEIENLKKGQADMKKQLDEIKKLLQARPAAAPARPAGPVVKDVEYSIGKNPVKGDPSAKLICAAPLSICCAISNRNRELKPISIFAPL